MVLLQGIIALSGRIVAMSPKVPEGIFISTAVMFVATYIFIALLMAVAPRAAPPGKARTGIFAPLRTALAFPVFILFVVVALRFHTPVPWESPPALRYASQAGFGFFYAAAHWAFFTCVERKQQAALYFAAFLAGVVLNELFHLLNAGINYETAFYVVFSSGYSLIAMLILFITVAQSFLVAWANPNPHRWTGDPPAATGETLPRTELIVLMLAFYLMNALAQGIYLINAPLATRNANFSFVALFACFCLPFFGRALASDLARGVRWIAALAAAVSIMTPAFSAFTPDPAVYRLVHAAASVSQWMFFLAMTVVLAQTVSGNPS